MGFDLYVVSAVIAAVGVWLVSPRFQSYDPPGDLARGFWSVVAGALWPLILVGAAQVVAVRYLARRSTHVEEMDPAPSVALSHASLRS